jgi:pimeloyl-ACP methyl ester carboxylesterase
MKHLGTARGELTAVQDGEGPDLVILHSLLTDRRAFDAVLPRLAETHRVTLFNLPGFHGSQPVDANVDAYVSRIREGFDAFAIKPGATLLGNGFGGTLALAFALAHGDRLGRLVICDAAAGFPDPGKQAFRVMAEKVAAGGLGTIAEIAANRVFHAEYLAQHPGVNEERKAALLAIDPVAFQAACRILVEADLLPGLAGLNVPTLVICGELDQATPPALNRAIAQAIPGAAYVELPACGHCPPLEQPDAFLKALGTP